MQTIFDLLPDDHFGITMEKTLDMVQHGQSVCVYAMPGGGRNYFSNQAYHLLQKQAPKDTVVHINFSLLTGQYTNYLKQVVCETVGCNKSTNWEDKLQNYLTTHRLIFVLDQIEAVVERYPETLTYLLKLRDFFPNQITFLFTADYHLIANYPQWLELGGILFHQTLLIPAFDVQGTKRVLELNISKTAKHYSPESIKTISQLSGGNPALIKYLGEIYQETASLPNINTLITNSGLQVRLNDIAVLVYTLNADCLLKLHILDSEGKPFSPLLTEYIRKYHLTNIDEIVPGLTIQEKRILTYLLKNKGKLLDKDRLAMLMKLTDDTYSLWAMYQAISRLKRKIKGKYTIKTLKGQGYLLDGR